MSAVIADLQRGDLVSFKERDFLCGGIILCLTNAKECAIILGRAFKGRGRLRRALAFFAKKQNTERTL